MKLYLNMKVASNFDKLIIYYFSGTGNARNAARWMLNVAEENGLETELINIDKSKSIEKPDLTKRTLVGFCSPTHGFNLPPLVLKFIWRFPKVKKADAFLLNTRAGLKLHKFYIPGLSGLAQILPALILLFKGFRIVGMQPLDLPSNWIFLHPGLRQKIVDSIYNRCHVIVRKFSAELIQGKRRYKALLSLPFDIAVIPLAFGYYIIGRFFLAKTLIASNACDNCSKCIIECPVGAISLVNDRPFWSYKCESCMRCVNGCPKRAIETAHSFSVIMLLLSSIVVSPVLIFGLKQLGFWEIANQTVLSQNIWALLDWFIFILFVFVCYRIMHFLMKFRIINDIVAFTSLSKYRFWRRYKAPR